MAAGPIPKRSDQRRRRNKPEGGIRKATGAAVVTVPPVRKHWHPVARDWFRSLAKSGQSQFYEPSDWQTAVLTAEIMSQVLSGDAPASHLPVVARLMDELLTSEGARRRARLELQRPDPDAEPSRDLADVIRIATAEA